MPCACAFNFIPKPLRLTRVLSQTTGLLGSVLCYCVACVWPSSSSEQGRGVPKNKTAKVRREAVGQWGAGGGHGSVNTGGGLLKGIREIGKSPIASHYSERGRHTSTGCAEACWWFATPPSRFFPPSFPLSFRLFLSSADRKLQPAPHAALLFGGEAESQSMCAHKAGVGGEGGRWGGVGGVKSFQKANCSLRPRGNKEVGDSAERERKRGARGLTTCFLCYWAARGTTWSLQRWHAVNTALTRRGWSAPVAKCLHKRRLDITAACVYCRF